MHLGAFSAGNPIFADGGPPCWGAGRWSAGAGVLGARMAGSGPFGRAQRWAGRCPGCWGRLWARRLARASAGWLRAKRLEAARVRSCLVGLRWAEACHRQGGRLRGAMRCAALGRIFADCCLSRVRSPRPSAHATASWPARMRLPASCRWCLGHLGVCSAGRFLDCFSCRFFAPGRYWETYPKLSDATWPVQATSESFGIPLPGVRLSHTPPLQRPVPARLLDATAWRPCESRAVQQQPVRLRPSPVAMDCLDPCRVRFRVRSRHGLAEPALGWVAAVWASSTRNVAPSCWL